MSKVIGVLGAGHMGGNMAQCLKDAGFAVFIYDAVDAARERMSDLGMNVCQSAKELASSCEIVLTSLPNSKVVEKVLIEDGFLSLMKPNAILIETSSTMPETMENIATAAEKCHVHLVDCPVSGGPNEARNGKLIMIVSAEKQARERCQDIIDVLGGKQFYVGTKPGAAKAVKIVVRVGQK